MISSTSLSPDGVRGWKPVSFFIGDAEEGAPALLLAPDELEAALACLLLDPAKISCWIKTACLRRKNMKGGTTRRMTTCGSIVQRLLSRILTTSGQERLYSTMLWVKTQHAEGL